MTKELGDTIPALGANENVEDYDDVLAPAKLFSLYSNWTWYVTEWDAETGLCFGLVEGFETELGLLRPHRAGGGNRVRQRPRRGARPVLEADDPRRDQETVVEDGGLVTSGHRRNQRRNKGGQMSRFAPKTLRRMPPATREIARLANELASVQTRLGNRISGLVSMEMLAGASQRVFCSNAAHAELVDAALGYFRRWTTRRPTRARRWTPWQGSDGRSNPSTPTGSSRTQGLSLSLSRRASRSARRSPIGSAGRGRFPLQGTAPLSFNRARHGLRHTIQEEPKWHAPSTR